MLLNKSQLEFYRSHGYLHIPKFFEKSKIDSIFQEITSVFSLIAKPHHREGDKINLEVLEQQLFRMFNSTSGQEKIINVGKQVQHLMSLWQLSTSEEILRLLTSIGIERPNIAVRPCVFFNSRHLDNTGYYWRLGSHQDWRSSQGSLNSVTIWFPYVDVDVELGALEILPKSHLKGLLPSKKSEYYSEIESSSITETNFIPVEMKRGDLLIFSSFLVHRSGTNTSQKVRWSSQLRYNDLNEPTFQNRDFPLPYVYKPFAELTSNPPTQDEIERYFNS